MNSGRLRSTFRSLIARFLRSVSDTEIVDWMQKRMVKLIRVMQGEGMNSKSLRLAVDPSAGRAASLLPDDIPFAFRQAAVSSVPARK